MFPFTRRTRGEERRSQLLAGGRVDAKVVCAPLHRARRARADAAAQHDWQVAVRLHPRRLLIAAGDLGDRGARLTLPAQHLEVPEAAREFERAVRQANLPKGGDVPFGHSRAVALHLLRAAHVVVLVHVPLVAAAHCRPRPRAHLSSRRSTRTYIQRAGAASRRRPRRRPQTSPTRRRAAGRGHSARRSRHAREKIIHGKAPYAELEAFQVAARLEARSSAATWSLAATSRLAAAAYSALSRPACAPTPRELDSRRSSRGICPSFSSRRTACSRARRRNE